MPEEIDPPFEPVLSPFWPMLILVLGFLIWFGFADFQLTSERTHLGTQLDTLQPTLRDNEKLKGIYQSVMNDVYVTSQKDPVAGQIIKDAVAAGLVRFPRGSAPTNAEPPPAAPPSPSVR